MMLWAVNSKFVFYGPVILLISWHLAQIIEYVMYVSFTKNRPQIFVRDLNPDLYFLKSFVKNLCKLLKYYFQTQSHVIRLQ